MLIRHLFFLILLECHIVLASSVDNCWVEDLRKRWQIPGIAIAIVRNGQIDSIEAYGKKSRSFFSQPVTKTTLFQIASLTKGITAYTASKLLNHYSIKWTSPIHLADPSFKLSNLEATIKCTFNDLASHQSGLIPLPKNYYNSLYQSDYPPEDIDTTIATWPLSKNPRPSFSYSNLGYARLGKTLEMLSNDTFENLVSSLILQKLTMESTKYTLCDKYTSNLARPHLPKSWHSPAIDYLELHNLKPAMGIVSTIEDMSKWLLFCTTTKDPLFKQTLEAQTLLVLESLFHTNETQIASLLFHQSKDIFYCRGWMQYDIGGYCFYSHSGIIQGMSSLICFCPENEFGIVILSNQAPNICLGIIANTFIDQKLSLPKYDWEEFALTILKEIEN